MKKIIFVSKYDMKTRGLIFLTTFSTIWLMVEPLAFFSILEDDFKKLGIYGYATLVLISLVITISSEVIHCWHKTNHKDIICLYLILHSTGEEQCIYVSKYFTVNTFLDKYKELIYAKSYYLDDDWSVRSFFYRYNLIVIKNGEQQLDLTKTFYEQGVVKGDKLSIKGKIRKEYREQMLSKVFVPFSWKFRSYWVKKIIQKINLNWNDFVYGGFTGYERSEITYLIEKNAKEI